MRYQENQVSNVSLSSYSLQRFDVVLDPHAPLYIIGVASQMAGLPIWTLRKLDTLGAVTPLRVGVRTRCYSQEQIRVLRYVKHLIEERGVNISAVKVVLEVQG